MLDANQLAAAFVAALPDPLRSMFGGWPALGGVLVRAVTEADERWPGITRDPVEFAAYLAERTAPAGDDPELPPMLSDLYLAWACVAGDRAALVHFDRAVLERTDRVLARLGLSAADADDVKQDVRARLLVPDDGPPRLASYQGSGTLVSWASAVAGRQGLALLRKQRPHAELDEDALEVTDDPHLTVLRERHRHEFKAAFQAAVGALEPRDRAVLRALLVDDRGVGDIATVYGIHRVTASRWIARIRRQLLNGTRERLQVALALSESDLDSAMHLVDSRLDLSLYRLLAS
jgi:RNA polymerase sigma-70 factor (ECF subfamily)